MKTALPAELKALAVRRCAMDLFSCHDALVVLDTLQAASAPMFGADGFRLTDDGLVAVLGVVGISPGDIADEFYDPVRAVVGSAPADAYFEFVWD